MRSRGFGVPASGARVRSGGMAPGLSSEARWGYSAHASRRGDWLGQARTVTPRQDGQHRPPTSGGRHDMLRRSKWAALPALAFFAVASTALAQQALTIGAPQPMTGPDAPFGDKFKKAYT